MKPIVVTAQVMAPAADVFAVLGDIGNHQALSCPRVQLLEISQDGEGRMLGVIDVSGPLGIHRRIATREVLRRSHSLIWGVAASSSGSVAHVCWDLEEMSAEQTRVSLSILRVRLRPVDQALLVLGGRRVLAGILKDTVGRLEALVPAAPLLPGAWPLRATNSA